VSVAILPEIAYHLICSGILPLPVPLIIPRLLLDGLLLDPDDSLFELLQLELLLASLSPPAVVLSGGDSGRLLLSSDPSLSLLSSLLFEVCAILSAGGWGSVVGCWYADFMKVLYLVL